MKIRHDTIRKKLLRYLDSDLPEKEREDLRQHLSACRRCRSDLKRLEALWKTEHPLPRVAPPPFIWTRLVERLEAEKQRSVPEWITSTVFPYFRAAIAVVSLLITIFLGVQFGELILTTPELTSQTASLEEELGMDYFSVIPPGSMGETAVLFTAAEQENSR